MNTRELTGPRLSTLPVCRRRAFYQATGVEESNPFDDATLRRLKRGRTVERVLLDELADAYAARGFTVERQREVHWPAENPVGVGHIDAYIVEEKHILEMICTTPEIAAEKLEEKALQATGYVLEDRDAERASILHVDRSTYDYKVLPVNVLGLSARWRAVRDEFILGLETGEPSPRVCESKRSGPAWQCAFRDHCFEGFVAQPDPIRQLAELAPDLERLARAEDAIRQYGDQAVRAREARDEIRERLLEKGLEPRETIEASGVRVSYSVTKPSATFSLAKFRALGHEISDDMAACVSENDGTKRWRVERVS